MPTTRYKALIAEIDNVELEFNQEVPLDADRVFFDNAGNDFVADGVQDAIVEARDTGTGFFAQEVFFEATPSSTTSNGWVTAPGYPFTSSAKDPGEYVIDFTAQVGQSAKQKQVGSRFQYRLGTAGAWVTAGSPILDALSEADAYQYRTSFTVITVPSVSVVQFRWQFGQTDSGGIGRIQETGVKITRRA